MVPPTIKQPSGLFIQDITKTIFPGHGQSPSMDNWGLDVGGLQNPELLLPCPLLATFQDRKSSNGSKVVGAQFLHKSDKPLGDLLDLGYFRVTKWMLNVIGLLSGYYRLTIIEYYRVYSSLSKWICQVVAPHLWVNAGCPCVIFVALLALGL